jgi:hypothetical protein
MKRARIIHALNVLALAALAAVSACSSSGSMFHTMPDRMDGLFIEIRAEKPNNSVAVYEITQDGMLHFAGGAEAKRGETEWSTELSAAQRQRVMDMVEAFGWLEREPGSTHDPAGHVYEISIRRGSTRQRHTVQGDHAQVVEMLQFLDEICMQRFDEFLERLPKAGEQKR